MALRDPQRGTQIVLQDGPQTAEQIGSPRNPRYWSEEDDAMLITLAAEGMVAGQIALRLGRSPRAIKDRAKLVEVKLIGLVEWRARRGVRPYG